MAWEGAWRSFRSKSKDKKSEAQRDGAPSWGGGRPAQRDGEPPRERGISWDGGLPGPLESVAHSENRALSGFGSGSEKP